MVIAPRHLAMCPGPAHTGSMDRQRPDDPLETLRRWEETGAVWRVQSVRGDEVTIGLFTCDGAEEMSRFSTRDTGVLAYVAGRTAPEAPPAS